MSMFGGLTGGGGGGGLGGGGYGSGGYVDQTKIQAAETELDMITGFFNNLVDVCHGKCLTGHFPIDADLSKGESVCIDRCVAKYFEANEKVGKKMQEQGQRAAAAAAAAGGGSAGTGMFGR